MFFFLLNPDPFVCIPPSIPIRYPVPVTFPAPVHFVKNGDPSQDLISLRVDFCPAFWIPVEIRLMTHALSPSFRPSMIEPGKGNHDEDQSRFKKRQKISSRTRYSSISSPLVNIRIVFNLFNNFLDFTAVHFQCCTPEVCS